MDMNYSGTEKGQKFAPEGVSNYSSLLRLTSLTLNEGQAEEHEKTSFSIPEKYELLESPPIINIVADQESIKSLNGKDISVAVILKELSSRSSRVIHNERVKPDYVGEKIQLSKADFDNLAFNGGMNIDVLIYEKSDKTGHLIQGFKRFSLNFSAIAGLWSIESVDPSFS